MLVSVGGCSKKNEAEFYGLETVFGTTEVIETEGISEENSEAVIYVDVCGAVKNPGVYKLREGERAFRAIELAGGMLAEAGREAVNQAALLSDGQQLYVPFQGETERVTAAKADGKVDLNRSDLEELMTLPGVGKTRAEAIIAYREEHGGFTSIEEIKNISGIGDAVFEKMKDKIKV